MSVSRKLSPLASGTPSAVRHPERRRRIGSGESAYAELVDFLTDEAALLDEDKLEEWFGLLAPDIFYWVPVRQTVMRSSGAGFDAAMGYLYETLPSLKMRVERVIKYDNAHSEDPASRTRRFVTNPRVYETTSGDEYFIQANLLVTRNRADANRLQLLSGTRADLVRRTPAGWRLSQRIVLLDQAVLEFANFGIFL